MTSVNSPFDGPLESTTVGQRLAAHLELWIAGSKSRMVPPVFLAELRQGLEQVARDAIETATLPGNGGPIRLNKARIRQMLDCERHMLAMLHPKPGVPSEELVAGVLLDALVNHRITTGRLDEDSLGLGLALLRANGDRSVVAVLEWIEALSPALHAALAADLEEARQRLLGGWPSFDHNWWPRVQERALVTLADGEVVVDGRADIVLGGPPTDRRCAIVEAKSREFRRDDLDDALLYALLVALRDNEAPDCVITCCGKKDAVDAIWIGEGELQTAAIRLTEAIRIAGELAVGREPTEAQGPRCGWCPDLSVCPTGSEGAGAVGPGAASIDLAAEDDDEPF
jgi:hypothetical protein